MTYDLCMLALVTLQPITAFGLEPDAVTLYTLAAAYEDLQDQIAESQR